MTQSAPYVNMYTYTNMSYNYIYILVDTFENNVCCFYCQLEKWREIAIKYGLELPEIETIMVRYQFKSYLV